MTSCIKKKDIKFKLFLSLNITKSLVINLVSKPRIEQLNYTGNLKYFISGYMSNDKTFTGIVDQYLLVEV